MIENDLQYGVTYHQRCRLLNAYYDMLEKDLTDRKNVLVVAQLEGLASLIAELTEQLDLYVAKNKLTAVLHSFPQRPLSTMITKDHDQE